MEDQIKDLNQSIRKYQLLQEKHISSFDRELMPNLSTLTFERAAAFADLKNNLDQFLNIIHDETQLSSALYYQDQLQRIMETDQQLKKKIQSHREDLSRHLRQAKVGKTAIRGYAASARAVLPKASGVKG